jgi:hypothetical protein
MPPIPDYVLKCSNADVEKQCIPWNPSAWQTVFAGHETLYGALTEHVDLEGGIKRSFIHKMAPGDPLDLFLATMAWGSSPRGYGPARTQAILGQRGAAEKLATIVSITREHGALDGWTALLRDHHVSGLGMAFGTKLLYFAGYKLEYRPRPLILDALVRKSLQTAAPGTVPGSGTIWRADYEKYLMLAEEWASEVSWEQEPDVVEYALLKEAKRDGKPPEAESADGDAVA